MRAIRLVGTTASRAPVVSECGRHRGRLFGRAHVIERIAYENANNGFE
jgi:hypothetical protein